MDVLLGLCHGHSDKEVAARLRISHGSVRVYRKRYEAKLGASGLLHCVLAAWRLGLLDIGKLADEVIPMDRGGNANDPDRLGSEEEADEET